jgi:hypothetical protein
MAANSYQDDNLDVYGERHPVVFDPRLRGAVAPFVAQPFGEDCTGVSGDERWQGYVRGPACG